MIRNHILQPVTISSYTILAIYCVVEKNRCVSLTASTYIEKNRHVEFELTFLLLEQSTIEYALDRCDHDVAYEYWYVEMKFTKSRKWMAQPRLKNTDFKIHVLGLCTKFVKKIFFSQVLLNVGPILTV